jgi:hypothetical protein
MMQAILKCSGRIVDVEPIPGDAGHMVVFGSVFLRTVWDAVGVRPVHIVSIERLDTTRDPQHVESDTFGFRDRVNSSV